MAQFDVYKNPNRETNAAFPFLLDIQSDLIEPLNTRVVAPLCPVANKQEGIGVLTPVLEIAGKQYIMLTPQIAGIPRRAMGASCENLARYRDDIIAALDLLITGI